MNLKLFYILAVCLSLYAQLPCRAFFEKDLHVLTMRNGLSDNTIHSICKDRNGFIWLSTRSDLNRYDGKQMRTFAFDTTSTNISALKEISDGLLCFESRGVLHAFDMRCECYLPVETEDGKPFRAIATEPVNDSTLWVLSNEELMLARKTGPRKKAVVLRVLKRYSQWKEKGHILAKLSLTPDKRRLCVADTHGKVVIADTERMEEYKVVDLGFGQPIQINHLLYDEDGNIWLSTLSYGLIRYNVETGKTGRMTYHNKHTANQLSHTDVFEVVRLEKNRYLAATWNGYTLISLNKHHPEEMTGQVFNNTTSYIFRDIETRMVAAYYDPQGILWIGTDGGGAIWSDLREQFYKRFYQDRHNEICSILGDGEGYVWLTTFHQGILRSRSPYQSDEELDFTPAGNAETRRRSTVLSSAKDLEGNLWFGNSDGTLTRYDMRRKDFRIIELTDSTGAPNRASVWSLLADSRGQLWAGTQSGLFVVDPVSTSSRQPAFVNRKGEKMPPLYIRALAETPDHSLWLGTTSGLYRYRGEGNLLEAGYEAETDMNDHSIRSLLAAGDGMLYIGYMSRFAVLSPQDDRIQQTFTTQDGLCNDFVGCLTEDDEGYIWLGSNSGISRYDSRQRSFHNYYVSGSNRSALCWKQTLFWGNNKNLTYFKPEKSGRFEQSRQVLITGLEVNNHLVGIGQPVNGQHILPYSISYRNDIHLSYKNRDFSLTFSNLSYSDEGDKYAYRLYPYQQEWIYTQGEERVSYTNLKHGNYTFEIKNIHPDHTADKATTLHITIDPHWSNSGWFRFCLFVAAMLAVLFIGRRIRLRAKRLEHEMQLEHEVFTANVERDKEKQLRMERERFFTEIAHELRTPLTLILAPLQELQHIGGLPTQIQRQLKTAFDNSKSLHALMDQLILVQKAEADMVKLKVAETDINRLADSVCEPFKPTAEKGHYQFHIRLLPEPLMLWIDAEKMASALRNLLSNAFKYTLPGGTVEMEIDRTVVDGHPFCRITVSDTGAGIPQEVKEHLFEPFTTGVNTPVHSTQTGIGMRIVKNITDLHHGYIRTADRPDHGTLISLYIPEGNSHFDTEHEKVSFVTPDNRPEPAREALGKEETDKKEKESVPADGPKKRLLIIDDNADIRQYIGNLFEHEFVIEEAADGEEGVHAAYETSPDLIICDIMMPVKDGLECCRELKEAPQTASIPILMLTAKSEDSDVIQALGIGADDYMMKPFNPEMLKSRVRNLIRQRERLQRLYAGTLRLKKEEEKEGKKEDEDFFIRQVIQVIEANLADENFNVKMLADQLHMSQPTLYRKIKQRSELATIDMIRSVRMSKAASLILENRYSMQEIAEMVGYNDTRTLRKHFAAQFGVSPSKYSEQNAEE